jgi:hypothetical protein
MTYNLMQVANISTNLKLVIFTPKTKYCLLTSVRILPFLTTFIQLTARLKNFLMGWLLFSGLKEGLVDCAIVCVKTEVILT